MSNEITDPNDIEPEYCGECGTRLDYFADSKDGLCPACQKPE